jgi:hypothetical protein
MYRAWCGQGMSKKVEVRFDVENRLGQFKGGKLLVRTI